MNTHCLFCGKRLGFFHNKKKPYCNDVHEDRYLEKQAASALGRLKDDLPEIPVDLSYLRSDPEPLPEPAYSYPSVEDLALDEPTEEFATRSSKPTAPPTSGWVSQKPDLTAIGDRSGIPITVRVTPEEVPAPSPVAEVSLTSAGVTVEVIEPPPLEPKILPAFDLRPSAQPGIHAALGGELSFHALLPGPQMAASGNAPASIDPPAPEVWPLMALESRVLALQEPPPMGAFRPWDVNLSLPLLRVEMPERKIAVVTTIGPQPKLRVSQPVPLEEPIPCREPIYFRIRREVRVPSFPSQPSRKLGVAPTSLEWNPLPGDREPAASKPILHRPALALPPP